MSDPLKRFSVAMPESLLEKFDMLVARRGLANNRSELVRDLVREAIVEDESVIAGVEVAGTLTIVYNHHANDLQEKLHAIQHAHVGNISASLHIHLDEHNCLEVIIVRGESTLVQSIANQIMGAKGVSHGRLTLTQASPGSHHHHHHHEDDGAAEGHAEE